MRAPPAHFFSALLPEPLFPSSWAVWRGTMLVRQAPANGAASEAPATEQQVTPDLNAGDEVTVRNCDSGGINSESYSSYYCSFGAFLVAAL